ncbi:hypothetical protein ALC56_05184 [Trachymyrmex septentrionalis]|uniref:Uncharacterized protein n=1 Tax=Trachymyrmex septentrionalis TaxID=34720 RepID=A0A195FJQ9_9HYME|nr:hypothetical protein ALC56_05184 [Trachymyrmex septentrionalis]
MCLELPRGKDVMNIKWALEAPDAAIYISIYAQVCKQPRIRCQNSNVGIPTFYLIYPAMLCNDAQEKTKSCGFALWQRRKKKPFVPLPWATTGTACLLRKYSLRVPKATQTKGNQTNEMEFSTGLRGVYSREFANLFLILSINIEETNRSLLLERHRRRLSQPNPEPGISQARPRTSERDCCCFVRPRKRRLLTALPLQNCGKGDAGKQYWSNRIATSILVVVATPNDAVSELSRGGGGGGGDGGGSSGGGGGGGGGKAGTDRREAPYPCHLSRRQAVATTRAYSVLLPYHGTREDPGAFHDKCALPSSG